MTELEVKAKDCIENHTHKLVDKPTKQDIYLREESIFISGYKLGATENGIQWHDLRKDPNDLPTTPEDENEWRTVLGQDGNLWFYNENERSWYTIGDDNNWGTGTHVPIAWCEKPQFKE